MNSKIFHQVLHLLQRTPVMPHDAVILAFQLLAWAQLTEKGGLAGEDSLDTALSGSPEGLPDHLERLASRGDLLGQAFTNAAVVARSAGSPLRPAAETARKLAESGVLDNFDPTDVAVDLESWAYGYATLPPELAELLFDLAVPQQGETVYCPWEFGGQLIARALERSGSAYAETLLPYPLPALVSLFLEGHLTLRVTDPIRDPSAVKGGQLERFPCSVAFPPMGVRMDADISTRDLFERFPTPKASSTVLMIQHIVAQTNGRAVIVVPNSLLFGPGADREARAHLLSKRQVEAVIALPSGLLSSSMVRIAVLVLNTNGGCETVRFLDADQPRFKQPLSKARNRLINGLDVIRFCFGLGDAEVDESEGVEISVDEVMQNDATLQVNRYVLSAERRRLQGMLVNTPKVALGDLVATVRPMPTINSDGLDGVEAFEVGAADLPPFGYIQQPSKRVRVEPRRQTTSAVSPEEQFLKPNDIVLIIKGSTGKMGVVPSDAPPPGEGGWIAGQSATVLRVRGSSVDPRAIAVLLRSSLGQEMLSGITSGAAIKLIQLRELNKLELPLLDLETAAKAADILEQESALQGTINRLMSEQAQLSEELWSTLVPPG